MHKGTYIIITPVRDEAGHIGRTIESVKSQTFLPALWIVVDDGSTDGTADILDWHASHTAWIHVVHQSNRGHRASGGGVIEAFYAGYAVLKALLQDEAWAYLVKLDGDLSFGPDYFERCFCVFAAEPKLGIGGGTVCQLDNGEARVDSRGDPPFHVRGATKIYRRECWEAISPLIRAPGWDTIDEVKANLCGWATRTFAGVTVIQHKPTGGADGPWRNAFKNGRANYISGYHPAYMMAKCVKRSLEAPVLFGSLALWSGYMSGYLKRVRRVDDPQVIQYLRQQQMRRLLLKPSIYA